MPLLRSSGNLVGEPNVYKYFVPTGPVVWPLPPTSWARFHIRPGPGVPLRSTPGFMLPPASRVKELRLHMFVDS
jgi:hypothetical protein